MIQIKEVTIGYQKPLLHLNDLSLQPGRLYALIGANGRGKSTFIKTLLGEIPSLKGDIFLDEMEISQLTVEERSHAFAFVSSRFGGIPYMKASEYVGLGRIPHQNAFGKMKDEDVSKTQDIFEKLGMGKLYDSFTNQISDGERQLLAIGRALNQETPILFLDEPTAFLDYANKKKILDLLKAESIAGKSVLFSSHDLEMTFQYADEIWCLDPEKQTLQAIDPSQTDFQTLLQICFPGS